MRLMISPSKNAKSFYVIKSVQKNGKNTSEIVEKLGTETFIKETYGVDDAEAWARSDSNFFILPVAPSLFFQFHVIQFSYHAVHNVPNLLWFQFSLL
mgnify:CR=1 FL=1